MEIKTDLTYEIKEYRAVDAEKVDFEKLYALYTSNKSYIEYFSIKSPREQLIRDMTILPKGCSKEQKHFLACFDSDKPIALLDVIIGYPDEQTCYIGLFMLEEELHRRGIGTKIISELCGVLGRNGHKAVRLAYGKHYTSAKDFWTKNGFSPIREVELDGYGEVIEAERRLQHS